MGLVLCYPRTTCEITPQSLSLERTPRAGVKSGRHDGAHRVIGSERRLALWITMHFKYDSHSYGSQVNYLSLRRVILPHPPPTQATHNRATVEEIRLINRLCI